MTKLFTFGFGFSFILAVMGLAMWATPVFGQVPDVTVVDPSLLASVGAGGSFLNLIGLGLAAGKGQQKLADHGRRLEKCEACLTSTPATLARIEATQASQGTRLDDIKEDLGHRFDRIEGRLP